MTLEHTFTDKAALDVRVDGSRSDARSESPGVAPGLRDPFGLPANRFDSDYSNLSVSSALRIGRPKLRAVTGIEWRREAGVSDSVLLLGEFESAGRFELQRPIRSAFGEFEWQPRERFIIDGAVRIDDAGGWAAQVSPSAAMRYETQWLDATVFVRWGEGFKLPSFFALGNPLVGNRSLRPETSDVIEAGIYIEPTLCCSLEITAFDHRYRNLIDFDAGPPPRLVNRSAVRSHGIETAVRARLNARADLFAQATFTDTQLIGVEEELRNRPKWRASAGLTFAAMPGLLIGLHAMYLGEMHDSSIPTGDVVLDEFAYFDLVVTWTASPRWRWQFAIDNLGDSNYEERVGVPAPKRTARAGVRYTF